MSPISILPREREFLAAVRRYQDIGYGRMMQIVSLEWFRVFGDSAQVDGPCVAQLAPSDQRAYRLQAANDPLLGEERNQ